MKRKLTITLQDDLNGAKFIASRTILLSGDERNKEKLIQSVVLLLEKDLEKEMLRTTLR